MKLLLLLLLLHLLIHRFWGDKQDVRFEAVCNSGLQIFSGNQNHDTPELRPLAPVRTRFVRIYPERATAEGLGLRLELTGCDLDGELVCVCACVCDRAFPNSVPTCSHSNSLKSQNKIYLLIHVFFSP